MGLWLDGILKTVRALGPLILVREVGRRLFGLKYSINGVVVGDTVSFRLLRDCALRGIRVSRRNGRFWAATRYGELVSDDLPLFRVLAEEDMERMYPFRDLDGKVIADIGGFLGETALMFLAKGARIVHVYEPLYFELCELNARVNRVEDRMIVHPYGVWWEECRIGIEEEDSESGLHVGPHTVSLKPLREVILECRPELVKMDSQGGEYALLLTESEIIRIPEEYIIEVHGSEAPIVYRMEKAGFKGERVASLGSLLSIWHFRRLGEGAGN